MENNGITGKKILLIFEDGQQHFSKKIGICTSLTSQEVFLDNCHIIPKHRIIRMEVLEAQ